MRYHYTKSEMDTDMYQKVYLCDHWLYDRCTLFKIGDMGLAIIQQRKQGKMYYWSEIDDYLCDVIYLHPKFKEYFKKFAGRPDKNGLYPTVCVRSVMWKLRMKPLPREPWETYFDRSQI